jgi:hypothetical protein
LRCISAKDLAKYLVGEVTRSRAEEMEEHLASCAACRAELEEMREMVGRIGAPTENNEQKDYLSEVRGRIERGEEASRGRRRRWPLIAVGGAVVVALVMAGVFLLRPADADDEFRVKDDDPRILEQDRWVGIRAFRMEASGAPASLGDRLKQSEYLIFTYTNLGEKPYGYLMIFAVDENGEVYWFHPAYTAAGEDPASIKISKDAEGMELKEQVRHEYPEGRLWIYGLFTDEPVRVSAIESMVKGTSRGKRIPLEGGQHILVTEVMP